MQVFSIVRTSHSLCDSLPFCTMKCWADVACSLNEGQWLLGAVQWHNSADILIHQLLLNSASCHVQ